MLFGCQFRLYGSVWFELILYRQDHFFFGTKVPLGCLIRLFECGGFMLACFLKTDEKAAATTRISQNLQGTRRVPLARVLKCKITKTPKRNELCILCFVCREVSAVASAHTYMRWCLRLFRPPNRREVFLRGIECDCVWSFSSTTSFLDFFCVCLFDCLFTCYRPITGGGVSVSFCLGLSKSIASRYPLMQVPLFEKRHLWHFLISKILKNCDVVWEGKYVAMARGGDCLAPKIQP